MLKRILFITSVFLVVLCTMSLAQTWNQVNTDGFGDPGNYEARSMEIYASKLNVGTYNSQTGGEVWAYGWVDDGMKWVQINTDGFGDAGNTDIASLQIANNKMYAGVSAVTGNARIFEFDFYH